MPAPLHPLVLAPGTCTPGAGLCAPPRRCPADRAAFALPGRPRGCTFISVGGVSASREASPGFVPRCARQTDQLFSSTSGDRHLAPRPVRPCARAEPGVPVTPPVPPRPSSGLVLARGDFLSFVSNLCPQNPQVCVAAAGLIHRHRSPSDSPWRAGRWPLPTLVQSIASPACGDAKHHTQVKAHRLYLSFL